ncbi:MAG: hypothetical protein WCF18_01160 [Chthoniobacteraceae bacterium]
MPASNWKYAENTFESSTANSWTLMNKIVKDHLAKLNAKVGPKEAPDTDIVACRDRVSARAATFSTAWSAWQNLDAMHRAKTDIVQKLLADLSSRLIGDWDIAIQGTFRDHTPEYAELLPTGRSAFQNEPIDERIQSVKTLGERLVKFSQLATLATAVTAYYGKLNEARDIQKGVEGDRDTASNDAETAREKLAGALYANVGRLMEKHWEEPHRIEGYFDLSLIRQTAAAPAAPAPVETAPASPANQASGTPRALESATPSQGAATTLVTEVTPRLTGNGSREHATV